MGGLRQPPLQFTASSLSCTLTGMMLERNANRIMTAVPATNVNIPPQNFRYRFAFTWKCSSRLLDMVLYYSRLSAARLVMYCHSVLIHLSLQLARSLKISLQALWKSKASHFSFNEKWEYNTKWHHYIKCILGPQNARLSPLCDDLAKIISLTKFFIWHSFFLQYEWLVILVV